MGSWDFFEGRDVVMPAFSTLEKEAGLNRSMNRRLKKTKDSSVCYQGFPEALAFRPPVLVSAYIWRNGRGYRSKSGLNT